MLKHYYCQKLYKILHILFCYQDNYTLEQSVGGMLNIMSSQVKTESFLMNLFLPLCFRVGIGKKGKLFPSKNIFSNIYIVFLLIMFRSNYFLLVCIMCKNNLANSILFLYSVYLNYILFY